MKCIDVRSRIRRCYYFVRRRLYFRDRGRGCLPWRSGWGKPEPEDKQHYDGQSPENEGGDPRVFAQKPGHEWNGSSRAQRFADNQAVGEKRGGEADTGWEPASNQYGDGGLRQRDAQ